MTSSRSVARSVVRSVAHLSAVAGTAMALLLGAAAGDARADILLTPSTAGVFGLDLGPANCEPGCVYTAFGLANDGSLSLLYKGQASDSGLFATSYDTVFSNTAADPSDALISFVGGSAIACPACYLAIKDGNHQPSYYFYDLAAWDGMESLVLEDFWPQGGAISHVSIWGASTPRQDVPEPATIALVGLALLAAGAARRGR